MWTASSCSVSGLPSALFVVPQTICQSDDGADVLVLGLGDRDHVRRVQVVDDLVRDLRLAGLVHGVARGRVVERRRHARAAGVAVEVAAVERVVAVVVEVLHVEVRDRVRDASGRTRPAGRSVDGSAPSATCGWVETETEYFEKSK